MSLASHCIAVLDSALALTGRDVVLRRIVGTAPSTTNKDITCKAVVNSSLREDELVNGITQSVLTVTLSPTDIDEDEWPGSGNGPSAPRRLDELIIDGRTYTVQAVDSRNVGNTTVRYEIQVQG